MDALVSVVIPAHNSERYILATLDSVLAQAHRPLEIVVVDDGSSDGTAAMVENYAPGIRVVKQERRGHPAARNAGIRAATGEFLGFIDHDDLWSPDKLTLQMEAFAKDPELDLVFGHIRNFFTPEMPAEERARIQSPMHPLPGLLQGAMLARRSSFERVGYFYEQRGLGDFLDWYGRAMLAGVKTEMLAETVLHRRIHANNYQRIYGRERREYLLAVKDLLDRRRGIRE
jgi:glycosyltransferase involved in cell wall biosynthesis